MTMTDTRSGYSAEAANEAATDLLTEHLMCRRSVLGHAWELYADPRYISSGMTRYVSAHCTRCHTKRHYRFAGSARIGSPVYEYPDHYKLSGQVTSEALWEEVFVRQSNGAFVVKKRIRGTKVTVPA